MALRHTQFSVEKNRIYGNGEIVYKPSFMVQIGNWLLRQEIDLMHQMSNLFLLQ